MSLDTQEQDMQKEIIDPMLNEDAAVEAENSQSRKHKMPEDAKEKLTTVPVKMLFNPTFLVTLLVGYS